MNGLINKIEDKIFIFLIKKYWKIISSKYSFYLRESPKLFFCTIPIINIKYWSKILSDYYYSKTVIKFKPYSINNFSDFDYSIEDILKHYKKKYVPNRYLLKYPMLFLFDYSLKRFNIFHLSFKGIGVYEKYGIDEVKFIKLFGSKIVMIPYGADFLQYNKLDNYSLRHGLMSHYPKSIFQEDAIEKIVKYWVAGSDIVIASNILEGKFNWNLIPFVNLSLNLDQWKPKTNYNSNNGLNGTIKIAHCPNHRSIKGTEFIIQAIDKLKSEKLKVELVLFEGVQNKEVLRFLKEEADILIEQLFSGYGLNGLEGMSLGVPVISSLSSNSRNKMYRRFSYLNECPILSSSPEELTNDLRILVKNPELRKNLGENGRLYAEKYHSEKSAMFMFRNIYKKIWHNIDVDLMNMYNPLNPDSYNNQSPLINHPLVENKIPKELMEKLNK